MDVNVDAIRSELDRLSKSKHDIERLIERKKVLILKSLPAAHGFSDMDEFICHLARFASSPIRGAIGSVSNETHKPAGKGTRYPAEVRVTARERLEAGDSLAEIARALGMTVATITRWRQKWGIASKRRAKRRGSGKAAHVSGNGRDAAA